MSARSFGVAPLVGALLVVLVGCGSDRAPATLTVDVGKRSALVTSAARFSEQCYRDGTQPETCTSGTLSGLTTFCTDLVGAADLVATDVVGAVTVYPADNPVISETRCLFTSPRASLSVELWRDTSLAPCSPGGAGGSGCIALGDGLAASRPPDLPSISVTGDGGLVVATVAGPTLDDQQLAIAARELTRNVFGAAVSAEDLMKAQPASEKPE